MLSKIERPTFSGGEWRITSAERKEYPPMREVPSVILCGGYGFRMKPVTGDVLSKHGALITRTDHVLDYPVDMLREAGIRQLILATAGHVVDSIREHARTTRGYDGIGYSVQERPRGIISAILQATSEFSINGPFILAHGDEIILEPSLTEMYDRHIKTKAPITELLTDHPDAGNNYVMWLNSDWQVTRVLRHPSPMEKIGGLTGTGLYIFQPEGLEILKNSTSWEEFIFKSASGGSLYGHPTQAEFLNVNAPIELELARLQLWQTSPLTSRV